MRSEMRTNILFDFMYLLHKTKICAPLSVNSILQTCRLNLSSSYLSLGQKVEPKLFELKNFHDSIANRMNLDNQKI